jgi:YHS domain-containing protein
MESPMSKAAVLMLAAACFSGGIVLAQSAAHPRVVLQGYDPVAYFTESRPVKGAPEHVQVFDGERYHFASAGNRATFNADPDRYAPQFAGMCAMAVSMGKAVEADPTVWKIVGGKLYVFSSARGLAAYEKNPALLDKAHANKGK